MAVLPGCHQIMVRLLIISFSSFFGRTPRLRAILSSVCGFFRTVSEGRNHQHVHHAFLLLPGTFQLIKKNRFMLNLGAWKETCVNFALFRLGLLSVKTVPVAHSSPPSYQTWRRQPVFLLRGKGIQRGSHTPDLMAFHNQSHCSLSLLSTHEKGRGNHCLCWPIQRILS